jgi:ABC-type phosphate/phosphonate transport system substrate-binding protein
MTLKHILLFAGMLCLGCILINKDAFQNHTKNPSIFRLGYSNLVFQEIDPKDGNAALLVYSQQLEKQLAQKKGIKINLSAKIYYSLDEVREDLSKRNVDLFSVPADQYFELKHDFNLEPCLAVVSYDNIFTQYVIIASVESNIKKISDLKGKTFSIPANYRNSLAVKWLDVLLYRNKLKDMENCFSNIKYLKNESNAVYNIFFDKTDCAIVRKSVFNTLVELNPQLKKAIVEIESSPEFVANVLAYIKDSPHSRMNLVIQESSELHLSKEGKSILEIFKSSRVEKITEADLQSTNLIVDEFNSIKTKRHK